MQKYLDCRQQRLCALARIITRRQYKLYNLRKCERCAPATNQAILPGSSIGIGTEQRSTINEHAQLIAEMCETHSSHRRHVCRRRNCQKLSLACVLQVFDNYVYHLSTADRRTAPHRIVNGQALRGRVLLRLCDFDETTTTTTMPTCREYRLKNIVLQTYTHKHTHTKKPEWWK